MLKSRRLRIFAGPNGSGKSTLFPLIQTQFETGAFINSDNLEAILNSKGYLNLEDFGLSVDHNTWEIFCKLSWNKTLIDKAATSGTLVEITIRDNVLIHSGGKSNSYMAALISSFIRFHLTQNGVSYAYETVMSHSSKIDEIEKAKLLGYKTYLYFVCLEDPRLNVSRVSNRIKKGGHAVPEDIIIQRYTRTLDLLLPALRTSTKAYVFDNSSDKMTLIAKVKNGELTTLLPIDQLPNWFIEAVINKAASPLST
jgi:predicted ABC-type ATPase